MSAGAASSVGVITRLLPDADLRSIRPCPIPQRHRSWSVALQTGDRCWVKVGRHDTPVAGVRREAAVLQHLDGRWSAPRLLAADLTAPATATAHREGRSLADHRDDEVASLLPSLASWLRTFSSTAALAPHPRSAVAAWDLFGGAPDVFQLLGPGAAFWESTAARLDVAPPEWPDGGTTATQESVHGSFDEDNVLVDPNGAISGVLDFEASRAGPVALDAAGMAADLLLRRGAPTARAWLALWPEEARAIEAFALLRLWHRHQHEALPEPVLAGALSLLHDPSPLPLRSSGRPHRPMHSSPPRSSGSDTGLTGI